MVVRHGAHVRSAAARRSTLSIVGFAGIGALAAVAAAAWLASPGARLASGGQGLADVSLTGLEAHIQSALYVRGAESHALVIRGSALVPNTRIEPGTSGVIRVAVKGPSWLDWLPWESRTLDFSGSTPALPTVPHPAIQRPLHAGLPVTFNEAVTRVRYQGVDGKIHTMNLPSPASSVILPLPAAKPGQHGIVSVAAEARSWEQYAPASKIQWSSVPYVTAGQPHTSVSPTQALTVKFSQPIKTPNLSHWQVAPNVSGQWKEISATKFSFTPSGPSGYGPGALIKVTIPGGPTGPQASSGSILQSATSLKWTTPPGSVMRLQELLAEQGYLPVGWTPAAPAASKPTLSSENASIYNPPQGQFSWKYPNLPPQLKSLWTPGQMSVVTKGAIMQFEAVNKLPVDGIAGPQVWKALIQDRLSGAVNPAPYTYISVTENQPETLELWTGNKLLLTTKTNTGIPATPTYLGTFPIYERLKFQIMRGKNPNGTKYADPVYWINYFEKSDAVHGFVRASYGFPQSLGCVEVPPSVAQTIFDTVNYGTLVTVNSVGVAPAPAH